MGNIRKTYKKRIQKKQSIPMKKVASMVKTITARQEETKRGAHISAIGLDLYHNTPVVGVLDTLSLDQGVQERQRIGNKVSCRGIKLRALLSQPADRVNTVFKVWAIEYMTTDTYGYSTFFNNITGCSILDDINHDRVRVLGSKVFKQKGMDTSQESGASLKVTTNTLQMWIPYKKVLTYPGNSATQPFPKTVMILITAYDALTTLTTDIVGETTIWTQMYFKDS